MLTGVNPLLRGKLLAVLDRMGHGDALVIADANFPAARLCSKVVDLPATTAAAAAEALFSVFPIDCAEPATLMESPTGRLDVQRELIAEVMKVADVAIVECDRHSFYALAGQASVIVHTGDRRPYGNLLVCKGGIST